jgi:hypothetical protein
VFEEVVKTEEAAHKRKAKKPWKKGARSISILSEEDRDPEDNIEPQDRKIADRIVVQSYDFVAHLIQTTLFPIRLGSPYSYLISETTFHLVTPTLRSE